MAIQAAQTSTSLWSSFTNILSKAQQLPKQVHQFLADKGTDTAGARLQKLEQRQPLNYTPMDPQLASVLDGQSTEANVCVAPSAGGPESKPKLIAKESDVTAGDLKVNDAYDLKLYELPSGDYRLDMSMKLQFFFKDGAGGDWTDTEKKQYVKDWQKSVESTWEGQSFKLDNGKKVELQLDFETQEGGWMLDHWEMTVEKLKPGSFAVSSVNTKLGNVNLDSEDLSSVNKKGGENQRGSVHEFGHMLGLDDEYTAGSTHEKDYPSIMNSGEQVQPRHLEFFKSWVTDHLVQP